MFLPTPLRVHELIVFFFQGSPSEEFLGKGVHKCNVGQFPLGIPDGIKHAAGLC